MPLRSNTSFVLIAAVLTAATGHAGDKSLEKALQQAPPLAPAFEVRRPVDGMLERFGQIVTAYRLPMGSAPAVVEIDVLANISGNEKLPYDIGQFARDALAKTGAFLSFRSLPEAAASKGTALPQFLHERELPPKPAFRLVGVIEGSEQVVIKQRNGRLDTQFGNGHTSTNGSANRDRGSTITALTIAFTLENTNSLDVSGASARYRIYMLKTESNNGFELYLDGNGFGIGSQLKVAHDPADAIYDVVAMLLIHVLGNGMMVPYSRCGGAFPYDGALEDRVRQLFEKLTDAQLEQVIQRFMLVDGFNIGRQYPLQPVDRAVLILEMQHRKLSAGRGGMVKLAMQFWQNLNYSEGAARMAKIYAENDRMAVLRAEQEAAQQAALQVDPREFGFAPEVNIITVDLSRVQRPDMLRRVNSAFQHCRSCGEVRWHPQKPLLGIHTAMKEADIQYLISTTGFPLEYVWYHERSPRLLVVPSISASLQATPVPAR